MYFFVLVSLCLSLSFLLMHQKCCMITHNLVSYDYRAAKLLKYSVSNSHVRGGAKSTSVWFATQIFLFQIFLKMTIVCFLFLMLHCKLVTGTHDLCSSSQIPSSTLPRTFLHVTGECEWFYREGHDLQCGCLVWGQHLCPKSSVTGTGRTSQAQGRRRWWWWKMSHWSHLTTNNHPVASF